MTRAHPTLHMGSVTRPADAPGGTQLALPVALPVITASLLAAGLRRPSHRRAMALTSWAACALGYTAPLPWALLSH